MLSLHPTIKSAGTYHATTTYSYRYIAVPVQLYRYNDYILVPVYSCTYIAVPLYCTQLVLLLVLLVLLLVLLLVPDWISLMPELRKRRWRSGKESEAEQEKSRHGYYPCVDDNDDDPWMNGPDDDGGYVFVRPLQCYITSLGMGRYGAVLRVWVGLF